MHFYALNSELERKGISSWNFLSHEHKNIFVLYKTGHKNAKDSNPV